jgi:hypothetical protein
MDSGSLAKICESVGALWARFEPPLPVSKQVTLVLKKYPVGYKSGPIHQTCNNEPRAIVYAINEMYKSLNLPGWGDADGSDFIFEGLAPTIWAKSVAYEVHGDLDRGEADSEISKVCASWSKLTNSVENLRRQCTNFAFAIHWGIGKLGVQFL